ncbi:MAG: LPS assembly protein LptD, partial [Bdellovibrionales bacterium]|nr:LPS assembly protein LptD [Bdellovibrionales bacterium]
MHQRLHFMRASLHGLLFSALILIVSALMSSAYAASKTDGLELSANDISRDYETRTVTLEGNVRIGFGAEAITCQKATINMKTQTISAEGGVVLETVDTFIEGEKIIYNYKSKVGEIHKGSVQAGQVVFLGDIIKKNSATKFVARSASYTSCATCPAAWSFSGHEIEAEIGGYAYIKYPILRVADFPILILPRILVPLKSTRQTGLLVPSFDYSSIGGTAISLPYFWAINSSQDLTYTIKNYEKRGLKHKVEYRYVLSPGSHGIFNAAYLRDDAFSPTGQPTGESLNFNRAFMSYKHYYDLPNNYVHRANLNLASDLRYPRDFTDEMLGHGDPALENKTSLTKNTNEQHFSIEAAHYTNLLKADAQADNNDSVHRFPELQYGLMEQEILNTNLFFKFDFNYTNFSRRDFAYDDVKSTSPYEPTEERDGQFDYILGSRMDRIRTGHRYIFQPSLSYPFHIGRYLDVLPSVTYNEAQYRFNVDPPPSIKNYERNAARRYLQTDISFKTKYSAVFGIEDGKSNRYKHEIEPEIIYSRIPYTDRPEHIFFGDFQNQPYYRHNEPVSNADFAGSSGLQFDYRDRLFNKNLATFVFSNYLIRKSYL